MVYWIVYGTVTATVSGQLDGRGEEVCLRRNADRPGFNTYAFSKNSATSTGLSIRTRGPFGIKIWLAFARGIHAHDFLVYHAFLHSIHRPFTFSMSFLNHNLFDGRLFMPINLVRFMAMNDVHIAMDYDFFNDRSFPLHDHHFPIPVPFMILDIMSVPMMGVTVMAMRRLDVNNTLNSVMITCILLLVVNGFLYYHGAFRGLPDFGESDLPMRESHDDRRVPIGV
jgi:hypothetical protein